MITKIDLTTRYNLSLNTVRETLKACGLNISLSEYTEEEIATRFDLARKMIADEQKSYEDVAIHFGVKLADELFEDFVAQGVNEHEQALRRDVYLRLKKQADDAARDLFTN